MGTDLILGLGAFVVSAVGVAISVWVMNQWKAQRWFDTHFDMAKRFALLAYKFDDEFGYAQHVVGPDRTEYTVRKRDSNETDPEALTNDMRHENLERIKFLGRLIQEMKGVNWEAKATIGEDFSSYIDKYVDAQKQLWIAILSVYGSHLNELADRGDPKAIDMVRQQTAILHGYDEGESLKNAVRANTEALANILAKYTFRKNKIE